MEKRKKCKEVSVDLREKIVEKHGQSQGYKSISRDLNVPVSTVRNIIKRFAAHGTVANLPGRGRKSKINKKLQRRIVRLVDKEPQLTSKQIQADLQTQGTTVSARTIRRHLNERGRYVRRPRRTPLLTQRRKKARLDMAIPIAILDCDLLLHGRGHKTLDRFDLDSVSDTFLLTQFGFPREFILYLVELLREGLCRRTQRSRAISPEVQVLAALGFYTSGSFQTSMGDTIGISQASMSRCVSNVTRALVEKAPQFITLNRNPSSREESFQEFQRVAGFPGVIGVLDYVQVAIKAPNSEDSSYVNKKGFHSVGCQLVCDARGLLLSAETHWPGGLKDTVVLERSALYKELQDTEEGWLLGDRRYPLRKWLMTPVDCPESPAEFRYNLAHTATHEIVDRTFRAIQTRFKCLDGTKGYLQYSPERSSSILLACCVLHNASLQSGLDAWTLERTDPLEQPESLEQRPEERDSQAEDLRKQLILKHFS